MPSGRFGKASLTSGAYTNLYEAPATGIAHATANVNFVNTGTVNANIRLAISASGVSTPAAADFIEYDALLEPGEVLERTGIVMSPGERILAYASAAGVVARANGFEG